MNFRAVTHLISILLVMLAAAVGSSCCVSYYYQDSAHVRAGLALSGLIMLLAGLLSFFLTRGKIDLSRRDGFGIVVFGWVAAGLFGSLPYLLSGAVPNVVTAMFETFSGFTTTGASALTDLETLPKGLLFWRSLTQWIGGMGVLILCVAILPFLGVGGMQIYRAEMPGPSKDRLTPRITNTAKLLWAVYVGMTAAETLLLKWAGMSWFDAINHAFTTVSTGGFSTHTASIAYFDNRLIETIIMVFMLLAGINFSLHYRALKGRPGAYFRDPEFRVFICLWLGVALFMGFNTWQVNYDSLADSMRSSFFLTTSIITTTGFGTDDFNLWPNACRIFFVMLMIVGGCAGSTSGGMKIVRLFVVFKKTIREVRLFMQPRAVMKVKLGRKALDQEVISNISAFFIIYVLCFVLATWLMSFFMPDLDSAATSVAATLGNIGPGLAAVGPSQNFAFVPDTGKVVLIGCMILGRLELYTVLALFLPGFWKR